MLREPQKIGPYVVVPVSEYNHSTGYLIRLKAVPVGLFISGHQNNAPSTNLGPEAMCHMWRVPNFEGRGARHVCQEGVHYKHSHPTRSFQEVDFSIS